jgi:DNA-binding transcriptional LysR family regulator
MPAVHVNSLALARRIACGSDALFPATAAMLAHDLVAGNLVTLDFHVPEMQTVYGIITLADRSQPPAALAFLELLRQVESEIAAAEAKEAAAAGSRPDHPRHRRRVEA